MRARLVLRLLVVSAALATLVAVAGTLEGGAGTGKSPTPAWSKPKPLSPAGVLYTALAASGKTLYAVYQDDGRVRFRTSSNQGSAWSRPVTIGSTDEIPLTESIAAQGAGLHLVYARSGTLFYRRSTNGGRVWSPEVELASSGGDRFFRVSIDVSGSRVHLAWVIHSRTTFATTGLFYRRSVDGGRSWQDTRLLVPEASDPGRPALSAVGNAVHLAWTDERDGNPPCYTYPACPEVYYSRSLDGGGTWGPERRLTAGRGSTIGRPDVVAVGSRGVVLVWQDDGDVDGQEELYARWSADEGASWSSVRRLTNARGVSEHPMLSALGRTVLVSWFDGRSEPFQVYARISTDGGRTWAREQQVTSGRVGSLVPRPGVTPGYAHVLISEEGPRVSYSRRALHR